MTVTVPVHEFLRTGSLKDLEKACVSGESRPDSLLSDNVVFRIDRNGTPADLFRLPPYLTDLYHRMVGCQQPTKGYVQHIRRTPSANGQPERIRFVLTLVAPETCQEYVRPEVKFIQDTPLSADASVLHESIAVKDRLLQLGQRLNCICLAERSLIPLTFSRDLTRFVMLTDTFLKHYLPLPLPVSFSELHEVRYCACLLFEKTKSSVDYVVQADRIQSQLEQLDTLEETFIEPESWGHMLRKARSIYAADSKERGVDRQIIGQVEDMLGTDYCAADLACLIKKTGQSLLKSFLGGYHYKDSEEQQARQLMSADLDYESFDNYLFIDYILETLHERKQQLAEEEKEPALVSLPVVPEKPRHTPPPFVRARIVEALKTLRAANTMNIAERYYRGQVAAIFVTLSRTYPVEVTLSVFLELLAEAELPCCAKTLRQKEAKYRRLMQADSRTLGKKDRKLLSDLNQLLSAFSHSAGLD